MVLLANIKIIMMRMKFTMTNLLMIKIVEHNPEIVAMIKEERIQNLIMIKRELSMQIIPIQKRAFQ